MEDQGRAGEHLGFWESQTQTQREERTGGPGVPGGPAAPATPSAP